MINDNILMLTALQKGFIYSLCPLKNIAGVSVKIMFCLEKQAINSQL